VYLAVTPDETLAVVGNFLPAAAAAILEWPRDQPD